MTDTTPLATLRALIGTHEGAGSADNPVILAWPKEIGAIFPDMAAYCANYTHDSIAWCGLMQALAQARHGVRPPFDPNDDLKSFLYALSWRDWGTAASSPEPGDILVFNFGGGDHHVTMYERTEGDHYICVGGNQSDQVKESSYAISQCLAVRHPPGATVQPAQSGSSATPPLRPVPTGTAADWSQGKGSWYSQFSGKYKWVDDGDAPGSAALGCPDDAQGVSFYNHATLGHWFEVKAPNGVISIEQQTDIGPNPKTGRTIDISAAAAERFGYTPRNFPTDSTFAWRAIAAPAAVASLSPKQQATAVAKARKDPPVSDPNTGLGTVTVLPPAATAQQPDPFKAMLANVAAQALNGLANNPDAVLKLFAGLAGMTGAAAPPPTPAPSNPAGQASPAAPSPLLPPAGPPPIGALLSALFGGPANITTVTGGAGLVLTNILQALDLVPGASPTTQIVTAGLAGLTGAGLLGKLSTIAKIGLQIAALIPK